MEQSIENVNLLVSGATGPLTKQLDAYIAWLDRNQYAISLMRIKVLQVLALPPQLQELYITSQLVVMCSINNKNEVTR